MLRRVGTGLALCAALLLQACASAPQFLELGTERAVVEQRLGTPTAVHALAGGTRLQYSGQPMGRWSTTWTWTPQAGWPRSRRPCSPGFSCRPSGWAPAPKPMCSGSWENRRWWSAWPASMAISGPTAYQDFGRSWFLHVHLDPQRVVRQILTLEEFSGPPDLGAFH
jgi:hypothetical protein